MSAHSFLPLIAAVIVSAATGNYNALRPTAAVGGAYGVLSAPEPLPPSPPTVDGCVDGCPCGGSGKEKSGDGIISFPCRCPETCRCKDGAGDEGPAAACSTGTCPLPSAGSSSGGCSTGNCPKPSTASRRRGLFRRWR